MPANKVHHFVPQFYLRNFSSDEYSVGTFILEKLLYVPTASIKGQCQRAYFYGRDQVREKSFQSFEDAWAPLFKEILSSRKLFSVFTADHLFVLLFLVMQRGRTVAAADETAEMSDKMAKVMLGSVLAEKGIDAKLMERYRIGPQDPVVQSLSDHTRTWPLLTDLRPALLLDADGQGFITSDHPVIYANQLLQDVTDKGIIGAQTPGLQIFIPLSSTASLMLYDDNVYGTGRKSPSVIAIQSGDVEQINALQIITAKENVYFDSSVSKRDYIFYLTGKYRGRRRKEKTTVERRQQFVMNNLEYTETHIIFSRPPALHLNLAFVAQLKKAASIASAWKANVTVRKPKLVANYQEFERLVERGERKGSDMLRYIIEALYPRM